MIRAILDTNVLLQSLIGAPDAASARVIGAYWEGRFQLVVSAGVMDEWLDVLMLPTMRAEHGYDDDELTEFLNALTTDSAVYRAEDNISASITRDRTDTKFLALAAASRSDYLVTNDRRHLLPLKRFGDTRIVLPGEFLRELGSPAA